MDSDKSTVFDIQDSIRREVYQENYNKLWADQLSERLEDFVMDSGDEDSKGSQQDNIYSCSSKLLHDATKRLVSRTKGQRLSLIEKLHLWKWVMQNGKSISEISKAYFVSEGTLRTILKDYRINPFKFSFDKTGISRTITNSEIIRQKIHEYTQSSCFSFTSKDVWLHLHQTLGVNFSRSIIIKIMKEHWGLSYKKGKSRPVGMNISKKESLKIYFSIKVARHLSDFEMLINIDESSFSRSTKIDNSWLKRGTDCALMNIWYSTSTSLITSITSAGEVFAVSTTGAVNSQMFIDFLKRLERFIQITTKTELQKCLIIMDNASIHRSHNTIEHWKSRRLSIAFIPAYTPELSPIEKYFARHKNIVLRMSRGRNLSWQSKQAQDLINESIFKISRDEVKRIWKKFTHEIESAIKSIYEII